MVRRRERRTAAGPGAALEVRWTSTRGWMVLRQVVQPLTVDLAVVPARSWRRGLEQAGRFARFCSRAVMLPRPPRELDDLAMQADYYGIGVVVVDADDAVLVVPEPFRRSRHTPAGWRFLEQVYAQLR